MSRLTPEHEKDDSITLHMEHYRRLVESLNNVTKERDALRAENIELNILLDKGWDKAAKEAMDKCFTDEEITKTWNTSTENTNLKRERDALRAENEEQHTDYIAVFKEMAALRAENEKLKGLKTPPSVPHYTEEKCQQLVKVNTGLLDERKALRLLIEQDNRELCDLRKERDAALSRIEKLRESLELIKSKMQDTMSDPRYAVEHWVRTKATEALKADDEAAGKIKGNI